MSMMKPLTREEVPAEHQNVFDYSIQWQEPVPQKSGRHKNRTMIHATCPVCQENHSVPVNDVRNWIRGVRSQMPGTHRKCKYPGRVVTDQGYVWLLRPDHPKAYDGRYVPEHILVMEEHLGRYLDRENESVHHIDGDKANNDISNLQLRKRYHGKGQAWECQDCGSHNVRSVALKT